MLFLSLSEGDLSSFCFRSQRGVGAFSELGDRWRKRGQVDRRLPPMEFGNRPQCACQCAEYRGLIGLLATVVKPNAKLLCLIFFIEHVLKDSEALDE